MKGERGELFTRYERLAARDDARMSMNRNDGGFPNTFKAVGDSVRKALSDQVEARSNDEAHAEIQTNLQMAMVGMISRPMFNGVAPEFVKELVERGSKSVARAAAVCESPIEKAILPWLVFADYGPFMTAPVPVHIPKEEWDIPAGDILLVPQLAIAKFRVDFGLFGHLKGQTKIVAFECDGSAYHDRVRDQQRDSYLAALGIVTVRATGAEIYRNPALAVRPLVKIFSEWAAGL